MEQKKTGRNSNRERNRSLKLGCLGGLLYFVFIIGASALLAAVGWLAARDVLALSKPEHSEVVEITARDTLDDVADKLKAAGLIEYKAVFKMYGGFSDAMEKIDPGRYELSTNFDYRAIVSAMSATSQSREIVYIIIPEGYEVKQIVELLSSKGVCDAEKLYDAMANEDFNYSFLEDLPYGDKNRLEGYLFPAGYEFYVNEAPRAAIGKMLSAFNQKLNADMRKRAGDLGMTINEVITLASIIEREAAGDEDRRDVASVFHNRLKSSRYPCLQSCATIEYILPVRKAVISIEDTKIDNPYNTYMYEGLPPGPIANPGLTSIRAALYPSDTDYYFFALQEDGTHKFSKTIDEHNSIPRLNP